MQILMWKIYWINKKGKKTILFIQQDNRTDIFGYDTVIHNGCQAHTSSLPERQAKNKYVVVAYYNNNCA